MNYAIKILENELSELQKFDNIIKKDQTWKHSIEIKNDKQSLIEAISILKAENKIEAQTDDSTEK